MSEIAMEQACFRRDDNGPPQLQARSPGFLDDWLPGIERLLLGFGVRLAGTPFSSSVFAQPLGTSHVAVVQVADGAGSRGLLFHVIVCGRSEYEAFLGDPFFLARQFPAPAQPTGLLATLAMPRRSLPARAIPEVQAILRRVKAGALKENEDPEHPEFERTADNSESPALLGGAQVLVDGGKLVFERGSPDAELVEGLWMLLPHSTRAHLWPATFAFGNALGFDVVVVPRLHVADFEGYTSEDQAAEYPAGNYEVSLQVAAETGNQRDLDALLNRRSSDETFKLGWILLALVIFLALAPSLLNFWQPTPTVLDQKYEAAAAAGIVATGDPWMALGLRVYGGMIWGEKK